MGPPVDNSGPPSQLFHDGKFQNSPAEISRSMNSFFINKVAQLREKIPQVDLDPHAKLREVFQNRGCEFKFKPAEPEEVLKICQHKELLAKVLALDNIFEIAKKFLCEDM